ncbi:MAG: hypothetical protein OXC38_00070 [Gammaproteobacteria bacterium]|nr:hypothetical protein [Gammaproteobacteria bacterium]
MPDFNDREALMFRAGHRVRFCCMLDGRSHLPRARVEVLSAPLYVGESVPDWIVVFVEKRESLLQLTRSDYEVAEQLDVHYYPTQRPEINFHAFTPLPARSGVVILRRKAGQ